MMLKQTSLSNSDEFSNLMRILNKSMKRICCIIIKENSARRVQKNYTAILVTENYLLIHVIRLQYLVPWLYQRRKFGE